MARATRKPTSAENPTVELGRSGLKIWAGTIDDEYLPDLRGARGRRVYREMADSDPIIGACLGTIAQYIQHVPVMVTARDESPEADDLREFIKTCLSEMAMTWAATLTEILSMLVYGWSLLEIVYSRRADGRYGWDMWSSRAQESLDSWQFDTSGRLAAFVQRPAPDFQQHVIPAERFLLFRPSTSRGNPEGRSLLRSAYVPWYYQKRIREIEGIGIERDLAGLPVMYLPPEVLADSTRAEPYKDIVCNVRRDEQEGVLLPAAYDAHGNKLYELTLLSTSGSRQFDTDRVLQRYQREIATSLLCDFVLLGHERVGSFALASSKTDVFALAVAAWLTSILSVINHDAIPRILALNGLDTDLAPQLTHGDVETSDLGELGQYIQALAGSGMPLFPNAELEAHLLRVAQLPVPAAGAVVQ